MRGRTSLIPSCNGNKSGWTSVVRYVHALHRSYLNIAFRFEPQSFCKYRIVCGNLLLRCYKMFFIAYFCYFSKQKIFSLALGSRLMNQCGWTQIVVDAFNHLAAVTVHSKISSCNCSSLRAISTDTPSTGNNVIMFQLREQNLIHICALQHNAAPVWPWVLQSESLSVIIPTVETCAWNNCHQVKFGFCPWLSAMLGHQFELPPSCFWKLSRQEQEITVNAGSSSDRYLGEMAWHDRTGNCFQWELLWNYNTTRFDYLEAKRWLWKVFPPISSSCFSRLKLKGESSASAWPESELNTLCGMRYYNDTLWKGGCLVVASLHDSCQTIKKVNTFIVIGLTAYSLIICTVCPWQTLALWWHVVPATPSSFIQRSICHILIMVAELIATHR